MSNKTFQEKVYPKQKKTNATTQLAPAVALL